MIEIDAYVVCPEAMRTYLCFVLLKDRLYRVSCDTCTEETHTHLLVAHYNPMAGQGIGGLTRANYDPIFLARHPRGRALLVRILSGMPTY